MSHSLRSPNTPARASGILGGREHLHPRAASAGLKYLLRIDRLCFDGQSNVAVQPPDRSRGFGGGASRTSMLAATALREWEAQHNYHRFSLALQGRTRAAKLAAVHPSGPAA